MFWFRVSKNIFFFEISMFKKRFSICEKKKRFGGHCDFECSKNIFELGIELVSKFKKKIVQNFWQTHLVCFLYVLISNNQLNSMFFEYIFIILISN